MGLCVLLITFPFPPLAGGGVSRTLNFIKHLPEYDIKPIILTAELSEGDRKRHTLDYDRLKEIPESLKVIRTSTNFPYRFFEKLESKLPEKLQSYARFFFYPFMNSHKAWWSVTSFLAARRVIKEHKVDLVYTSASPHSVIFLGSLLKLSCKTKLICDLRDPYTDGYQWHWPGKLHWQASRLLEKVCFSIADKIIVNTNEVKKLYIKRGLKSEDKIEVITNGF